MIWENKDLQLVSTEMMKPFERKAISLLNVEWLERAMSSAMGRTIPSSGKDQ